MDFDIAKFVEDPTVEVLESCRKADLLQSADYFQIDVVRSGTRQAIKTRLNEALLEIEVLPACMVPKESTLIDSEEYLLKAIALKSSYKSLDYEVVKAAILRAYELVPEAYRQKFRGFRKSDSQTFVEFAREKERMWRWECITVAERPVAEQRIRKMLAYNSGCPSPCQEMRL
ncbi:hypothetical protein SKAU_G00097530 [Synaphobranchus kaupii]|uniref:Uncharacterized protein n=1 Tax=Synaphobranchus kaupii TaxID=118154 RepID=A0A9Q1FXX1_SYNKA|nr:hypothetical protein SKAU_G00097530 [Synaphobranchus kaupii]